MLLVLVLVLVWGRPAVRGPGLLLAVEYGCGCRANLVRAPLIARLMLVLVLVLGWGWGLGQGGVQARALE
jgi:hypothetical protein